MLNKEPYFLSNPEWYEFDEEEIKYILTDKATKEVIESYEEFYSYENNTEEIDGELYIINK